MEETVRKTYVIDRFLEFLKEHTDDRGIMADLRHGLSEKTQDRAWPHLARNGCNLENEKERKVMMLIGSGYAMLKKTADSGNMGDTLRRIAQGQDKGDKEKGLKTFEGRFRRLLSCRTAAELCDRLSGILKAAERKDVDVNLKQLFWDLVKWDNPDRDVKVKWASHYWGTKDKTADTEKEGGTL
jgi:CRISPR type I-E-associated protein CasB/Cse2